jgi:hypothetical protein
MTVILKNKPPAAQLDAALRRAGFKHGESVEFKVSHRKVTIVSTLSDDDTRASEETPPQHQADARRQDKALGAHQA